MDNFQRLKVDDVALRALDLFALLVGKTVLCVGLEADDGQTVELVFNPQLSDRDVVLVAASLGQTASKSR